MRNQIDFDFSKGLLISLKGLEINRRNLGFVLALADIKDKEERKEILSKYVIPEGWDAWRVYRQVLEFLLQPDLTIENKEPRESLQKCQKEFNELLEEKTLLSELEKLDTFAKHLLGEKQYQGPRVTYQAVVEGMVNAFEEEIKKLTKKPFYLLSKKGAASSFDQLLEKLEKNPEKNQFCHILFLAKILTMANQISAGSVSKDVLEKTKIITLKCAIFTDSPEEIAAWLNQKDEDLIQNISEKINEHASQITLEQMKKLYLFLKLDGEMNAKLAKQLWPSLGLFTENALNSLMKDESWEKNIEDELHKQKLSVNDVQIRTVKNTFLAMQTVTTYLSDAIKSKSATSVAKKPSQGLKFGAKIVLNILGKM